VEKKYIHTERDGSSVYKEKKESFNSEQLEFLIRLKTNHGIPPKDSKPPFTPRQIEKLRAMGIMKDRPAFNTMQMEILRRMSPDPAPPQQQYSAVPQASCPNPNPKFVPHAPGYALNSFPNITRRMAHPLNRMGALEEGKNKRFPYPTQIYQPQNSPHHKNFLANPPQQIHRKDPKWTHTPITEYGSDSGLSVSISYC